MATNPDFRDLFSALSAAGADFLLVGAHAVMFYTAPRYTKDLDIWVRASADNAARVHRALLAFGAPMGDLTVEDLAAPGTVFQIGIEPNRLGPCAERRAGRVDVATSIDGVDFEAAWGRRVPSTYGGAPIAIISAEDLLALEEAQRK